jgi:trk system potassium uptake protein TrkA
VEEQDEKAIKDLDLPERARIICYYREGKFFLADGETKLQKEDEVVILTHSDNLPSLRERWEPRQGNGQQSVRNDR